MLIQRSFRSAWLPPGRNSIHAGCRRTQSDSIDGSHYDTSPPGGDTSDVSREVFSVDSSRIAISRTASRPTHISMVCSDRQMQIGILCVGRRQESLLAHPPPQNRRAFFLSHRHERHIVLEYVYNLQEASITFTPLFTPTRVASWARTCRELQSVADLGTLPLILALTSVRLKPRTARLPHTHPPEDPRGAFSFQHIYHKDPEQCGKARLTPAMEG